MNNIIDNNTMDDIRRLAIYVEVDEMRNALIVLLQYVVRFDQEFIRAVDEETIRDIQNITNIEENEYRTNYTNYFDRMNYILIHQLFMEPMINGENHQE